MVLPAGFALPPVPYLVVLTLGVGIVGSLLYRRQPAIEDSVMLALVPWIGVGSTLHVVYQIGMAPATLRPLFGTPSVYLTTFVMAGAIWLWAGDRAPLILGLTGTVLFVVLGGFLITVRPVDLRWPVVGMLVAIALAGAVWVGLYRLRPAIGTTGRLGGLVIVAHSVDGVSTAIGVDVLGFGERTPASRIVLEVAGSLPTAELLGVGWLFVVVKVGVASLVVWLFADYVHDDPQHGRLLLTVIAALGLGPGIHNLLLYTVA